MIRALHVIQSLVDGTLQLLLPLARNRVCYRSFPDYSDNAYHVYRHALLTRSNLEHVWLLSNMASVDRILREFSACTKAGGTRGNTLRVVHRRSLIGYFLYLTSPYLFHTHGSYPFSTWAFRKKIVSLWHGMPIKCVGRLNLISPNPRTTFGTIHIATSHFFKYVVACAFNAKPESVKVLGLPRCDALRFPDACGIGKAEVRQRLNIPADARLVLWMPTYRKEMSLDTIPEKNTRSFLDDLPAWALDALNEACRLNGCIVVAKLHPGDPLNRMEVSWNHPNIRLLTSQAWLQHEIQVYDLIAASDALISDVSSVLIDYLVTDNPIGVLGFDPQTYTRDLTFPIDLLLRSGRYQLLSHADDVDAFFRLAGSGAPKTDSNDISAMLYQEFTQKSSEAILVAVGL